jgi:prophage regulatory protein
LHGAGFRSPHRCFFICAASTATVLNMFKILRRPETQNRTGLGRSALYAREKDGRFPKAVKIGPRLAGHPEHEVDAWVQAVIRGATDDELRELVKALHAQRGYKPDPKRQAFYDHLNASRAPRGQGRKARARREQEHRQGGLTNDHK